MEPVDFAEAEQLLRAMGCTAYEKRVVAQICEFQHRAWPGEGLRVRAPDPVVSRPRGAGAIRRALMAARRHPVTDDFVRVVRAEGARPGVRG